MVDGKVVRVRGSWSIVGSKCFEVMRKKEGKEERDQILLLHWKGIRRFS